MRFLRLSIEWGEETPDPPEAHAQGAEAMVESVDPERAPIGFLPMSDPIRREMED